ncbi:MAG: hypothetical protein AAGB01_04570 [Cyanobacteria bacterium P01_F01_bin.42]
MSFSLQKSNNDAVSQSLFDAINLGLITSEQAQFLYSEHNEDEVMLILEQIASAQMEGGRQCVGDQCTI